VGGGVGRAPVQLPPLLPPSEAALHDALEVMTWAIPAREAIDHVGAAGRG